MCLCREMWLHQVREFGKYPDLYSLLLLDNRGTGESDIPPAGEFDADHANYSLETLAADAWAVADEVFGPDAKVHVAGWSMGSMVAQRIALQRTQRVASLCLMSGSAGGWLWSNVPSFGLARAAFDLARAGFDVDAAARIAVRLHFTDAYLSEFVLDETSSEKLLRRDAYDDRYKRGMRRDAARDVDGSVFRGHLAAVRGHDITRAEAACLADADFDIVVLYGDKDRVVTPNASRDLARRLGAEHYVVPGAHFITDEACHEVNHQLKALWQTSSVPVGAGRLLNDSFSRQSVTQWSIGSSNPQNQGLSPA